MSWQFDLLNATTGPGAVVAPGIESKINRDTKPNSSNQAHGTGAIISQGPPSLGPQVLTVLDRTPALTSELTLKIYSAIYTQQLLIYFSIMVIQG